MSRIIVTTCGTSLFETTCWESLNDSPLHCTEEKDKIDIKSGCEEKIKKIMQNDNDGSKLASEFVDSCWNSSLLIDMPAEIASLKALTIALSKQDPPVDLGEGDKIILLHSISTDGLYCARVIKNVIKNKLFKDIEIEMYPKNLDPTDKDELLKSLEEIWTDFYKKLTNSKFSRYILNLTGGYKITSMILSSLSVILCEYPVTVIYLHEETPEDQLFGFYWDNNELKLGYITLNRESHSPIRLPL